MAKKLYHFNEKSKFEEKKSEIPETSIVFVKDSNEIYTHGNLYSFCNWGVLKTEIPAGYNTLIGSNNIQILDSTGAEIYVLI